jgi:hypothetical protein
MSISSAAQEQPPGQDVEAGPAPPTPATCERTFWKIKAGKRFTFFIRPNGQVYYWRNHQYENKKPRLIPSVHNIVSVCIGRTKISFIDRNGGLFTSEISASGTTINEEDTQQIILLDAATGQALDAGVAEVCVTKNDKLCILLANGTLYTHSGEPNPRHRARILSQAAKLFPSVISISNSYDDLLILCADGRIFKMRHPAAEPTLFRSSVASFSCGQRNSAAVTKEGGLITWGFNWNGRLGWCDVKEVPYNHIMPAGIVDNLSNVVKCAAGTCTMALTSDGRLHVFGAETAVVDELFSNHFLVDIEMYWRLGFVVTSSNRIAVIDFWDYSLQSPAKCLSVNFLPEFCAAYLV